MARPRSKHPTDGELEILHVLWDQGPLPVRAVHAALEKTRDIGTTTVLKLMQIMVEKGLLERDESVRPQVYRAQRGRTPTQKALVGDFLERVFGGEPGKLVVQALAAKRATAEEREAIRELLDRLETDSPQEDPE